MPVTGYLNDTCCGGQPNQGFSSSTVLVVDITLR